MLLTHYWKVWSRFEWCPSVAKCCVTEYRDFKIDHPQKSDGWFRMGISKVPIQNTHVYRIDSHPSNNCGWLDAWLLWRCITDIVGSQEGMERLWTYLSWWHMTDTMHIGSSSIYVYNHKHGAWKDFLTPSSLSHEVRHGSLLTKFGFREILLLACDAAHWVWTSNTFDDFDERQMMILWMFCSRVDFLCCFKLWWGSDGLLLHWRTSEQPAREKIGRELSCFWLWLWQVEHKAYLQQSLEICCGISCDVLKSDADWSYWKIQCEDGINWFQAMATPNIRFPWTFWIHYLPSGLSMK